MENLIKNKYVNISIYLSQEKKNKGHIIFPIDFVLTKNNDFLYWEILHIDEAIESIKMLDS